MIRSSLALSPLIALCGCELVQVQDPTCVPESWSFSADKTLTKACSPYSPDDSIEISGGKTLTIEAGVEIRMPPGEWIRVTSGKLVAKGTAADPIVLTSNTPASGSKGQWHGLVFTGETLSGSELSHAKIRFGGQEGYGVKGCVWADALNEGVLTLNDLELESCAQSGLAISASKQVKGLSNIKFAASDAGFWLDADRVGDLQSVATYTGTPHNRISASAVTKSAPWLGQPVAWRADDSIEVAGDPVVELTLKEGLEVHFEADEWLRVGAGMGAKLVVAGTAERPVVLAAKDGGKGTWLGLALAEDLAPMSSIRHLTIRGAGKEAYGMRGCVTVFAAQEGRLTIEDSRFEDCDQAGLGAHSGRPFASVARNFFAKSDAGMWLPADAIGAVAEAQTYEMVTRNRIYASEVTESATWTRQGVAWEADDSIEVAGDNSPILTLEAGVTVELPRDAWLRVGAGKEGGIVASGTAERPVTIGGKDADNAGTWLGVALDGDTLSGTSFTHTVFRNGGQDAYGMRGCVTLFGIAPGRVTVEQSTFKDCAQSGLSTAAATKFAAVRENRFEDLPAGLWLHVSAVGAVAPNQTYVNTAKNRIEGGTLEDSATWTKQSVPWHVDASIQVAGENDPVLTLQGGVTLAFERDHWLEIGSGNPGGLEANGTMSDMVMFTSRNSNVTAGDWLGVRFRPSTLSGSVLSYVEVNGGGQDAYGQKGGVTLEDTGTRVAIENSVFARNAQSDVWVDCRSTPNLSNNTYGSMGALDREPNCM